MTGNQEIPERTLRQDVARLILEGRDGITRTELRTFLGPGHRLVRKDGQRARQALKGETGSSKGNSVTAHLKTNLRRMENNGAIRRGDDGTVIITNRTLLRAIAEGTEDVAK